MRCGSTGTFPTASHARVRHEVPQGRGDSATAAAVAPAGRGYFALSAAFSAALAAARAWSRCFVGGARAIGRRFGGGAALAHRARRGGPMPLASSAGAARERPRDRVSPWAPASRSRLRAPHVGRRPAFFRGAASRRAAPPRGRWRRPLAERAPCLPSRMWISSRTNSPAWVLADFPWRRPRDAAERPLSGMGTSLLASSNDVPRVLVMRGVCSGARAAALPGGYPPMAP